MNYSNEQLTWREVKKGLGRNEMPSSMVSVHVELSPKEQAFALHDAWTLSEFPTQELPAEQWISLFSETTFQVDDNITDPSEYFQTPTVRLYRGTVPERVWGMSWTSNVSVANFFASRYLNGDGKIYELVVPVSCILAVFNESRREEEHVVDYISLLEMFPDTTPREYSGMYA